jgi:hypothetical protein
VAVAAIAPILAVLPSGATLAWRDTAMLYGPMRALVAPALRSFRLPLWNPYEGTGQPLFALLAHGVLHPVSILSALLRADTSGYLLGYVAFAAAGAFLAARSLGASRPAATGAALAYALSGYLLGMMGNAVYLAGAASTPWIVAGMRYSATRGFEGTIAAGLAVACAIFAGEPQALLVGAFVGAACALSASGRAGLLRAGAGALLGVALGAVQLVPSLELYAQSARLTGISVRPSDAQWPLDPARLVELVTPGFFVGRIGQWKAPVFASLGTPAAFSLPWAPSIFVGVAVLILAGLAARRSKDGRTLAILSLLLAWVAMGHHLGASQLLSRVPVWGAFRYAEKLVGPLTLCLALGAALGLDLAARSVRLAGVSAGIAGLAALAMVTLALWPDPGLADPAALARRHLTEGLLHALVAAGLLSLASRTASRLGARFPHALALLLYVEALAAAPFALHVGSGAVERACPPRLEALPPGARLQSVVVTNAVPERPGLDPIDALTEKFAHLGVASLNLSCGVETLEVYTSFETLRTYFTILNSSSRVHTGPRFGASHLLSEPPRTPADASLLAIATRGATESPSSTPALRIWEAPHRPWASFATRVETARTLEQAVSLLGMSLARRDDAIVIEGTVPAALGTGRVLAIEKAPERIGIEAEAEADALLVVNEAFDPGWSATIDGAPVELLPADVLVRAVRFPPGRHRLVMQYRPASVTHGILISTLTAVLSLALWGWSRVRAPRAASHAGAPPEIADPPEPRTA